MGSGAGGMQGSEALEGSHCKVKVDLQKEPNQGEEACKTQQYPENRTEQAFKAS